MKNLINENDFNLLLSKIQNIRNTIKKDGLTAVQLNSLQTELDELNKEFNKSLGTTESFKLNIVWEIGKYFEEQFDKVKNVVKEGAKPFEIKKIEDVVVLGNVTLNNGVDTLWKLFAGMTGVKPFNVANAKIAVGSSAEAENPTQTGIITPLPNGIANISKDPSVSNRAITFEANFSADMAVGEWNEIALTNGDVAFNRKVDTELGEKGNKLVFTVRLTITGSAS